MMNVVVRLAVCLSRQPFRTLICTRCGQYIHHVRSMEG